MQVRHAIIRTFEEWQMDPQTIQMLFYYGVKVFWLFLIWKVAKAACNLANAHEAKIDRSEYKI